MRRAAIALGANLGPARESLCDAVAALASAPGTRVVAVSGLWHTRPVGGPDQPDYLNAVVLVDTEADPGELLDLCQAIENAGGRVRDIRWGPRTLDLDILDIIGVTSDDPALTLPHPRAHERAFVLAPWAQVAPAWPLAVAGRSASVAQWLAEVGDDGVRPDPDSLWWPEHTGASGT